LRARRYIAERNPAAASRVHAAILSSVGRLANHPNLSRPARVGGTRELTVSRTAYTVAYAIPAPQPWPPDDEVDDEL